MRRTGTWLDAPDWPKGQVRSPGEWQKGHGRGPEALKSVKTGGILFIKSRSLDRDVRRDEKAQKGKEVHADQESESPPGRASSHARRKPLHSGKQQTGIKRPRLKFKSELHEFVHSMALGNWSLHLAQESPVFLSFAGTVDERSSGQEEAKRVAKVLGGGEQGRAKVLWGGALVVTGIRY